SVCGVRCASGSKDAPPDRQRGEGIGMGARLFGASVLRREDARLVTGRGRYVARVTLPGMLHVALHRSPHPPAPLAPPRRTPRPRGAVTPPPPAGAPPARAAPAPRPPPSPPPAGVSGALARGGGLVGGAGGRAGGGGGPRARRGRTGAAGGRVRAAARRGDAG